MDQIDKVRDKEEDAFKRTTHICFSPKGRVYQISYATEASKKSLGSIFLKTKEGIVLFVEKSFDSELLLDKKRDPLKELLQSSLIDFQNGVFIYFLGTKFNLPKVQRELKLRIEERSEITGPNFFGLKEYILSVISKIIDYEIYRNNLSGLTYLVLNHHKGEKSQLSLLRPNNKVQEGTLIFEGRLSLEDKQEAIAELQNLNISLNERPSITNLTEKGFENSVLKEKYLIYNLNFETNEISIL